MPDVYFKTHTDRAPLTIQSEPWVQDASCAGVPGDVFFPEFEGARWAAEAARKICRNCPVQALCAEFAVRTGQTEGIWAGLTPRQIRRRREMIGADR